MEPLIETFPQLGAYQISLIVLALLSISVLIQSLLTAPFAFVSEEQIPGEPLKGDSALKSFRVLRTYANSVENFPAFGWALFVAIVAGASPTFVNWLCIAYLAVRLGYWFVYYSGYGKHTGGPRTMLYVLGVLINLGLAGMAIFALI